MNPIPSPLELENASLRAENERLRATIARVRSLRDVEDDRLNDALDKAFDKGWMSKDNGSSISCRVSDELTVAFYRLLDAALEESGTGEK